MTIPRIFREAAAGYEMFTTRDPHKWMSHLEDLGKLHAEVWRDDLPEQDGAWAEAHREEFGKWIDGRLAPPWPMLLAAVRRAFLASYEAFGFEPTEEGKRLLRLSRTLLWTTLTAEDIAQGHGPEALRAFQRGFRLGSRRRTISMKNISQVVDPPWLWNSFAFKNANLPGPSATRERVLLSTWREGKDWEAAKQALRELYASAWREDVPEEDREWAQTYRLACADWIHDHRRNAVAEAAYEAYLRSSDGIFAGEHAPPKIPNYHPWRFWVERVDDAPDGESELATAEAAVREYWDALWREAPPWNSDPDQPHWLAAVRAARKTLAEMATFVPRR